MFESPLVLSMPILKLASYSPSVRPSDPLAERNSHPACETDRVHWRMAWKVPDVVAQFRFPDAPQVPGDG